MGYLSSNTAIKRNKPSVPAKYVSEHIIPNYKPTSILDFGCGFGKDVEYYKSLNIDSIKNIDGWDPGVKFFYLEKPIIEYDLITCIYVLNVCSHPENVVRHIIEYMKKNSLVYFASRSFKEIEKAAKKGNWTKVITNLSDKDRQTGYYSSILRKTFQRGFMDKDYEDLAEKFDLEIIPIKNCGNAICSLMRRKK